MEKKQVLDHGYCIATLTTPCLLHRWAMCVGARQPCDTRLVPSKPVDAPVRRRHTDGVTVGCAGHRDLAGARVVCSDGRGHGGTDRVEGTRWASEYIARAK